MITSKIKALFQFIEFLHSNIENFKQYDEVIKELYLLDIERKKLSPKKNFADKLKYDEVQADIEDKFKVIQENIIQPINSKVLELNICDMNKTETLHNWNISEISDLINNFKKEDLPEIFKHKSKYLEFRTKTNCTYFKDFFFDDLDEMLKELFDYFKETKQNEFETFETKAIPVNDFREVAEQIQKGHKKFTLPIDFLNRSKVPQSNNEVLPPHQTEKNKFNPEFEKWLKQDDLFDYYIQNPEQQQSIFEDYQREQVFKDVDSWVQWMTKNTDLAKEHFPDFIAKLEKRIKESPPHLTANIIQKLPENYFIWKVEIDKLSGITRKKKIDEQIQLLEVVLSKIEFETEIEQQAVESVRDELTEQLEHWKTELKNLPPQPIEVNSEPKPIEIKPVLKSEAVQIVFDIVKDFFSNEQQNKLKIILETGNNANEKLLFKDNGNRLTDTFKKLIEHDFITGCQKQDLINWIILNFTFLHRKIETDYKPDTVEKTISRNFYPCKSPLIEIKNGQILKIEQPRTKKYR